MKSGGILCTRVLRRAFASRSTSLSLLSNVCRRPVAAKQSLLRPKILREMRGTFSLQPPFRIPPFALWRRFRGFLPRRQPRSSPCRGGLRGAGLRRSDRLSPLQRGLKAARFLKGGTRATPACRARGNSSLHRLSIWETRPYRQGLRSLRIFQDFHSIFFFLCRFYFNAIKFLLVPLLKALRADFPFPVCGKV